MNTPSLIIAVAILVAVIYGAWRTHQLAQPPGEDETTRYSDEDRWLLKWLSRGLIVVAAVASFALVQSAGVYDVADPFQGQDARGALPTQSVSPRAAGQAPTLEGVAIQPDVDAVAREHQQQLREFEDK